MWVHNKNYIIIFSTCILYTYIIIKCNCSLRQVAVVIAKYMIYVLLVCGNHARLEKLMFGVAQFRLLYFCGYRLVEEVSINFFSRTRFILHVIDDCRGERALVIFFMLKKCIELQKAAYIF